MNRIVVLLCCALGLALSACVKPGEPPPGKPHDSAPAETPTGQAGTAPGNPPGGPGAENSPCQEDRDCGSTRVCEACGPSGKCCVTGCHEDSQCGSGRHCHQVQCIRAPCPGQCE